MLASIKRGKLSVAVVVALALSTFAINTPLRAQEEDPQRTGLRPDAPPYGVRGSFAVGVMDLAYEVDGNEIPCNTFYPALNPEGAEEKAQLTLDLKGLLPPEMEIAGVRAILDATPDAANGPYPLVVWSHGHGSNRLYTHFLLEHVASYGFVAITCDHPGNTLTDLIWAMFDPEYQTVFETTAALKAVMRPVEIQQVIDYAVTLNEAEGGLAGIIDAGRIAVMGHSYGGYTAFAVGGAQIDDRAYRQWCDEYPEDASCVRNRNNLAAVVQAAGLDAAPEGLWPSMGDPRVDVIVGFAPSLRRFLPEGLARMTVPAMILAGTADVESDEQLDFYQPYEALPNKTKALVVLENANHYVFGACPEAWTIPDFFYACSDPVWDMDRAHDLINHFTTAFLLAELYDDADAAAALAPNAVQFPGVTYETTGF